VSGDPVGGGAVDGSAVGGGPVGDPLASAPAWNPVPAVSLLALAQVTLTDHDGVAVAAVSGEVDISSVDHVAEELNGLSNLATGLVVDLRSVAYLDSSGISLLHDLAQRLRRRSQILIIVCPPDSPPRRILELTGLDGQAVVFDALAPAIEAMGSAYEDGEPAG
jgi:anti-anti-sigma factor